MHKPGRTYHYCEFHNRIKESNVNFDKLEKTHHCALDDAEYLANIFVKG